LLQAKIKFLKYVTSQTANAFFLQSKTAKRFVTLLMAKHLAPLVVTFKLYLSLAVLLEEHQVALLHNPVFFPSSARVHGTPLVHMKGAARAEIFKWGQSWCGGSDFCGLWPELFHIPVDLTNMMSPVLQLWSEISSGVSRATSSIFLRAQNSTADLKSSYETEHYFWIQIVAFVNSPPRDQQNRCVPSA
jgi:hypothetical protein